MSSLKQSISSSIFSYEKYLFLISFLILMSKTSLIDSTSVSRHCKDSSFKGQFHCHVLTGNLKIENDSKLLKIF